MVPIVRGLDTCVLVVDIDMAERVSDKLVWGEGETIYDYLRRVDAYALLGDEKKTIGKALLGLGHRISVIDSLSEEDRKSVKNLKAALLREFGDTTQQSQRQFLTRQKRDDETYGMYLSALRALFKAAYASSPGQSSDDEMSPVGRALVKSTFLAGIDNAVAGQLRLLFPDADIQDLPTHAKAIQEAVGLQHRVTGVSQVAEQAVESDQIAALRSEVQTLTAAVDAIRLADTGRGRAAALAFGRGCGAALGGVGAGLLGSQGPPVARPPAVPDRPAAGRSGAPRAGTWGSDPGEAGRGRASRGPTCWTCGESGHVQRWCTRAPLARGRGRPAPVVCWACGEFGHTRYQCPRAHLN